MTVAQAQTELDAIASGCTRRYPEIYPDGQGFGIVATPLQDELTRAGRAPTLLLLLGTAAFVLLIACANVANLSLARLLRPEREMALRAALGADRGATVRQLLAEGSSLPAAAPRAAFAWQRWACSPPSPRASRRGRERLPSTGRCCSSPRARSRHRAPLRFAAGAAHPSRPCRGAQGRRSHHRFFAITPHAGRLVVAQVAVSVMLLVERASCCGRCSRCSR